MTRVKIAQSLADRPKDDAHIAAIRSSVQASWALRRAAKAERASGAAPGRQDHATAPHLQPPAAPGRTAARATLQAKPVADAALAELEVDAALAELTGLKAQVSAWVRAFTIDHGRPPSREDAVRASPDTHDAFMRYVALVDFVRTRGAAG